MIFKIPAVFNLKNCIWGLALRCGVYKGENKRKVNKKLFSKCYFEVIRIGPARPGRPSRLRPLWNTYELHTNAVLGLGSAEPLRIKSYELVLFVLVAPQLSDCFDLHTNCIRIALAHTSCICQSEK